MKVQALELRTGDRIMAYCNNHRRPCKVKHIEDSGSGNITLTISLAQPQRNSLTRVIRFQRDALIELINERESAIPLRPASPPEEPTPVVAAS